VAAKKKGKRKSIF